MMSEKEIEFLENSNWIEREYSDEAMEDAIRSWRFAKGLTVDIDIDLIKKIHRRIMRRLNPRISGKIRKVEVVVGDGTKYHECLKPEFIEKELEKLCKSSPSSAKAIKNWHIKFEGIHPFEDGNGRAGRIIMNAQRLRAGLPVLVILNGERFEYYKWFRKNSK